MLEITTLDTISTFGLHSYHCHINCHLSPTALQSVVCFSHEPIACYHEVVVWVLE